VVVAALQRAHAGTGGTWTRVSTPRQSGVAQIGIHRTADGVLHVVWQRSRAPLTDDLLHTPISASGNVGSAVPIVSSWGGIGDAALVAGPDGGLRVFFAGGRSTNPGETLVGLNTATAPASGTSWSLTPASIATRDFAGARTPAAALGPDGTPFQTWYSVSTTVVHRGLDPNTPNYEYTAGSGETGTQQNIVTASTGRMYVAWCAGGGSNLGVFVQEVNATTGEPVGSPHQMPGSTTTYQGKVYSTCAFETTTSRTPLVARVGGGVYVASAGGYPQLKSVLVWRLAADGSVAQTITVASSKDDHRQVALGAGPDGRVWVAWSESASGRPVIFARRTGTNGVSFGPLMSVAGPAGSAQTDVLDLAPQRDKTDVLGRFGFISGSALWHTQLAAGQTVTGGGGITGGGGPQPEAGKTVVASVVSGVVLVRRKGTRTFVRLTAARSIPVGSELDTEKGRMRLRSAAGGGKQQRSDFYQGRFVVTQKKAAKPVTNLVLSAPLSCRRTSGVSKPKPRRERHLWGNGKGSFRTAGRYAAATVRGTIWLTQDTCSGTLIRVTKGQVDVFDLSLRRHFLIGPGQSHFARRP
jgi:hypothetical protein